MLEKIVSNKLYFLGALFLCVFVYLLNFCASIHQYAIVLIIINTIFSTLRSRYGRLKSLGALALAVAISFALLGELPCYINEEIVDDLVLNSSIHTLAPFIIFTWFLYILLDKLKSKLSPVMSNALMFIMKSITDGFIIVLCFVMYGFKAFAIMIIIANIPRTANYLKRNLKNQ